MRFKTNESQRGQPDRFAHGLAQFLGFFSVGLGLGEIIFGGVIARALGLEGYEWVIRAYGVREIITGILIFALKDSTPWIWFRVFGDLLDVATVAFGYTRHLSPDRNFIIAFIALAGALAIDLYCALRLSRDSKEPLLPTKNYEDRSGLPEES